MSAFFVQITAGTGPIEARRFALSLGAHIEGLCEARGLTVREIIERHASMEILVEGDAETALADQLGTHALVARSADRGKAARKRWFAGVAVHAALAAEGVDIIDPRDLEITATTARGPGGQHVNKTATAVRVRHLPTGLTVRVSDERSQHANLRRAIARIAERLSEEAAERSTAEEASRRAAHYHVERGAPVRTYRIGKRGALEPSGRPVERA